MKLKQKKGWADRRLADKRVKKIGVNGQEYLTGCALNREGVLHGEHRVFHSHNHIRQLLGDENPYEENPGDNCGFMTNTGRFVGRLEASTIAVLAGQAAPMYEGREILSSDITWRTT